MTKTVVEWLPILETDEACRIIIRAMTYAVEHKNVHLHGYVIMPNHVHYIFSAPDGGTISNMMRDLGQHTSRQLSQYLIRADRRDYLRIFQNAAWLDRRGSDFKVWLEGFHPIPLMSAKFFREKLEYIHQNPVKKGFVGRAEDWKYSSARNYLLEDHSIIAVECK